MRTYVRSLWLAVLAILERRGDACRVPSKTPSSRRTAFRLAAVASSVVLIGVGPAALVHERGSTKPKSTGVPMHGTILFDNGGVYSVKADGSGLRKLADPGEQPAWSPDGKRIAYVVNVSHVPGDGRLWVMKADGSGKRQLTGF